MNSVTHMLMDTSKLICNALSLRSRGGWLGLQGENEWAEYKSIRGHADVIY